MDGRRSWKVGTFPRKMALSRQALWYRKNKERLAAEKRIKYLKENPNASPYKNVVIAPKKNDVDAFLDKLEQDRKKWRGW